MYVDRMFLLVIGILTNVGLAVYGLMERPPDFASFMLAIFITNLMLYTSFYIIMKLRHGEKILGQPLFYIGLSSVSWGAAMYFFINKAITWKVSFNFVTFEPILNNKPYNKTFQLKSFPFNRKELQNLEFSTKSV